MRRPALLVLLSLAPLLGGCRYTFLPLVPPVVEARLPVRVVSASLTREGEALTVRARIDGRFEPGYLSVRWYDGSRPLGEDSLYLDGALREASFTLGAPEPGAYRAVLSFGDVVLRQVELYEVQP